MADSETKEDVPAQDATAAPTKESGEKGKALRSSKVI